ncbi:Wadjet anti-phage system protein JetD domain-containing protein [Cupriavidus sp. TMH.W2]|uniref:Wadjet anti-phage system protein JetD domain-containing protein n=1 Tax=Cupriavidus sp. TMH.W2 TaxID=3434465 RepID=UPI003D7896E5
MSADGLPGGRPAALAALLNALVDRIEAKPFAERRRDISYPLSAGTWPEFFSIALHGERMFVWRALEALQAQPGLGLALDQRRGQRDLDIWERSPRLIVGAQAEAFLRDETGRRPGAVVAWMAQWRQAVLARFSNMALCERLLSRPILILSRPPEQVLERLAGIPALAGENLMLHEAASRQFWGLSKILNGQQETIALLLDADTCPFPDKPVQLLVAARTADPAAPILFVENAATFESMAVGRLSAAEGFVLIYASGYKASARRLRQPGGSSVYFAPDVIERNAALIGSFPAWLQGTDVSRPVHFWGDLDFSGMDILKELRVVFPGAQAWKAGYEALLARLLAEESHAPDEARKSGQADPGLTGCSYADEVLLPALRRLGRFVDQESL